VLPIRHPFALDPFAIVAYLVYVRQYSAAFRHMATMKHDDFRHTPGFLQTIKGLFFDLGPSPFDMYYAATMAMCQALINDKDADISLKSEVLRELTNGIAVHPKVMSMGTIDEHRSLLHWLSLMSELKITDEERKQVESLMVRCVLRQASCDFWRGKFFRENTDSLFRLLATVPDARLPFVLRTLRPMLVMSPRTIDVAEKTLIFVDAWRKAKNCNLISDTWAPLLLLDLQGRFPLPFCVLAAFARPRISDRHLRHSLFNILSAHVSLPRIDHVDAVICTLMGVFDRSLQVDPSTMSFVLTEVLLAPSLGGMSHAEVYTYRQSALSAIVPDVLEVLCARLGDAKNARSFVLPPLLLSFRSFARSWALQHRTAPPYLCEAVFLTLLSFSRQFYTHLMPEDMCVMLDMLAWVDRFRVDSLEYRALVIEVVARSQDDAGFRQEVNALVRTALYEDPLRAQFLLGAIAHASFLNFELPTLWPELKQLFERHTSAKFTQDQDQIRRDAEEYSRSEARHENEVFNGRSETAGPTNSAFDGRPAPRDDDHLWLPVIERAHQLIAFCFQQHVDAVRPTAIDYLLLKAPPNENVVINMLEDMDKLEAEAYVNEEAHDKLFELDAKNAKQHLKWLQRKAEKTRRRAGAYLPRWFWHRGSSIDTPSASSSAVIDPNDERRNSNRVEDYQAEKFESEENEEHEEKRVIDTILETLGPNGSSSSTLGPNGSSSSTTSRQAASSARESNNEITTGSTKNKAPPPMSGAASLEDGGEALLEGMQEEEKEDALQAAERMLEEGGGVISFQGIEEDGMQEAVRNRSTRSSRWYAGSTLPNTAKTVTKRHKEHEAQAKEKAEQAARLNVVRNAKVRVVHSLGEEESGRTGSTLARTGRFLDLKLWPLKLRRMDVDAGDLERLHLVLTQLHEARHERHEARKRQSAL